jgi:glycosyltransferase involved in cell wall biosynthesis
LCTEVAALSPRLADEWAIRFPFLRTISVVPIIAERSKAFNLFARGRGNSAVVFGFAARVEAGKGPLVLLEALTQVNRQSPLAVVRIAGVGEQLAEVKGRARSLALDGTWEFVGFYSEPLGRGAFMNSLDVFVLPSLAEGTPNSIVEAMAHGIPIIASDVGGISDMIGNDAGILVPPGDADALAAAMRRLILDREAREQMGRVAKERYQKLFATDAVVPLLMDTYTRLTANTETAAFNQNGHHPWANRSIIPGRT